MSGIRQPDIALDLVAALTDIPRKTVRGLLTRLVPNLGTDRSDSLSLPFHGVQTHLVGERLFARKNGLSLLIGVDHDEDCGVVVHFAHDRRDRFDSRELARFHAVVTGYDLISAGRKRTDKDRGNNAVLPNALRKL